MFIYIRDNKLTRLAFSFVSLSLACIHPYIYFGQEQWSLDNGPILRGNTEIFLHLRLLFISSSSCFPVTGPFWILV
jgi:hypothetical protein